MSNIILYYSLSLAMCWLCASEIPEERSHMLGACLVTKFPRLKLFSFLIIIVTHKNTWRGTNPNLAGAVNAYEYGIGHVTLSHTSRLHIWTVVGTVTWKIGEYQRFFLSSFKCNSTRYKVMTVEWRAWTAATLPRISYKYLSFPDMNEK